MAFFKRELSPIERFESALKDKQAARQKLAERSSATETELVEKRSVAERLAVAGAANAKLDRAEAKLRAVDELAKALRTELAELDDQIVSTERALADAKAQYASLSQVTQTVASRLDQAIHRLDRVLEG